MNQDSLRELLYDAMPTPPLELATPPLDGIRRRARRRRLAVGLSTASGLIAAVVGVGVMLTALDTEPFPPAATPPDTTLAGPWIFAVVSADEHRIVIVREGRGAAEPCSGTLSAQIPLPGPVKTFPDRIVVPIPTLAAGKNCIYSMPIQLDEPLMARTVVDGSSNTALPILHEKILPRPLYPRGISQDTTFINIVGEAERPTWMVLYNLPLGYTIIVTAVPADVAPPVQVQEKVTAHGRTLQILKPLGGVDRTVVWTEEGWQITMHVGDPQHGPLDREELQRVIDNLVWQ